MFSIPDEGFRRFENYTVKLSAKETNWTSFEVRTQPTLLETLISKYDFRPVKLPDLSRKEPQATSDANRELVVVGGGVGGKICHVKKNVWECNGSTSASKTEVTVRSFCKKQFEKQNFGKATLILWPFQLEQKYQTNCGYKHNETTSSCCKNFHLWT